MRAGLPALAALITSTLAPVAAGAVERLERLDRHINDVANVLAEDHRQQLRRELAALQTSTGAEVTVVIIKRINDHRSPAAPAAIFAQELLAAWDVGDQQRGDGVLILIVIKDFRFHIALGHGHGRLHRSLMNGVLEDKMLPHFKGSDWRRGIHEGVFGVVGVMTNKTTWLRHFQWHLILGVFLVACVFAGGSILRKGRMSWGWAYYSVILFIVVLAFKLLAHSRHNSSWGGGSYGSWS